MILTSMGYYHICDVLKYWHAQGFSRGTFLPWIPPWVFLAGCIREAFTLVNGGGLEMVGHLKCITIHSLLILHGGWILFYICEFCIVYHGLRNRD